jgi:hypothetical protein
VTSATPPDEVLFELDDPHAAATSATTTTPRAINDLFLMLRIFTFPPVPKRRVGIVDRKLTSHPRGRMCGASRGAWRRDIPGVLQKSA